MYKRSFFGPYLLCVHPKASKSLLEELHEGVCESHTGGRSLSHGLLPRDIGVQACKRRRSNKLRNAISVKGLHQIFTSLEEFSILFLTLVHLLNGAWTSWDLSPKRLEIKKYLLVCTDYFTKWVEVEPLANIRDVDVKKFIWKNIVTRFGVLYVLISDNDLQFDNKAFRKY